MTNVKLTMSSFAELYSYLNDLEILIKKVKLDCIIYKEGTNVGQIAYHTAKSVSYYVAVFILEEKYVRNRDNEFNANHSLKEILDSLEEARKYCTKAIDSQISLSAELKQSKEIYSRGFTPTNIMELLQHITAHTAEHYGHIVVSIDK